MGRWVGKKGSGGIEGSYGEREIGNVDFAGESCVDKGANIAIVEILTRLSSISDHRRNCVIERVPASPVSENYSP